MTNDFGHRGQRAVCSRALPLLSAYRSCQHFQLSDALSPTKPGHPSKHSTIDCPMLWLYRREDNWYHTHVTRLTVCSSCYRTLFFAFSFASSTSASMSDLLNILVLRRLTAYRTDNDEGIDR